MKNSDRMWTGAIFAAFGLYFAVPLVFDVAAGSASSNYSMTKGEVVGHKTQRDWIFSKGDVRPLVQYKYRVADHDYTADRLSSPPPISRSKKEIRTFMDEKYPIGSAVDVYFDSHDPNHATLTRGIAIGELGYPIAVILAMTFFAVLFCVDFKSDTTSDGDSEPVKET